MINTSRIVPITAVDLISMYGLILSMTIEGLVAADSVNPGQFEIESADSPMIANEPIATCDFADGVSTATIYFVPAYDYTGFTANGAAITAEGEVNPDGRTLYKAEFASNAVTITQVGF